MPRETTIVNAIMRWLKNLPNCEARKAHGSVWSVAGVAGVHRGHARGFPDQPWEFDADNMRDEMMVIAATAILAAEKAGRP